MEAVGWLANPRPFTQRSSCPSPFLRNQQRDLATLDVKRAVQNPFGALIRVLLTNISPAPLANLELSEMPLSIRVAKRFALQIRNAQTANL